MHVIAIRDTRDPFLELSWLSMAKRSYDKLDPK
jgi:hypothetical protein